ncbi:hypothetical protein AB0O07_15785 [Streptomyces sp. NPDC093085]|uniref:DUF7683 domain-containing protein n=1 Tax=Streptomyces sp. NPDC093085 TaxID=3155068 RepID=UPI00343B1AE6
MAAARFVVSRFDANTDELISEAHLEGVDVEALAVLCGQAVGSFVESYPIGDREAAYLAATYGMVIDLASGDYFLEVFA